MKNLAQTLPKEEFIHPGNPLCPGCPGGTMYRWITKVLGKDTICQIGATCIAYPALVWPHSLKLPSLYIAMATTPAALAGTSAAIRVLKRKGRIATERKINVIALAGDGSAGDIGMASLSGAAERNENGLYFVFDNEAYMNTGIQRSGSTPQFSWTTSTLEGKPERKKDLPRIMAAHDIPYVATVSFAYPDDFIKKVEKARDMAPGFKYFHIHAPCPTGWRFPESKTIEVARLAVETGMWLLYEVDHGQFRLTERPDSLRPVNDYLAAQGRFSGLDPSQVEVLQKQIQSKFEGLKEV